MDFKLEQAKPHTIKKFEIIDKYVDGWARKILGYNGKDGQSGSKGVIYIDCMSNAGMYINELGDEVRGTALRVAATLQNIVKDYPDKEAILFFNDYDQEKIDALTGYLREYHLGDDDNEQVTIVYDCGDRDEFLEKLDPIIRQKYCGYNTLLLYDPYKATLNWDAITPFINRWGEVIINHMVSDTTRGAKQAKKDSVKQKYQKTYQKNIEDIIAVGSDKAKLEKIIVDIIKDSADSNYDTFIASFPFFTRKNGLLYNLIYCTHHVEGMKLFKHMTWDAFGGKSSMKKTNDYGGVQLTFNMDMEIVQPDETDEDCYTIKDVAKYIFEKYGTRDNLNMKEIYADLDVHPVFPSDGYKPNIKKELKERYKAEIKRDNTVIFPK